MRKIVKAGAYMLILVGMLHAVRVWYSADEAPYLWAGSLFLVVQGMLTLRLIAKLKVHPRY